VSGDEDFLGRRIKQGTQKTIDGYAEIYPNTADSPIPVALQTVGSLEQLS
jgi:hypothetical protein